MGRGSEPKSVAGADARTKKKKRKSSGGAGPGADAAGPPGEGKRDLFADADEAAAPGGAAELQINEKFAQTYERKKRFQELNRRKPTHGGRGAWGCHFAGQLASTGPVGNGKQRQRAAAEGSPPSTAFGLWADRCVKALCHFLHT